MTRPNLLETIELVPDIIINPEYYVAGKYGIIDEKGRLPTVGKQYANMEAYIFIKKQPEE